MKLFQKLTTLIRRGGLAAALALGVAGVATTASAVPITFEHTGASSNGITGTINGNAFTTTSFTITATADTDDVQGVFVNHLTASINIDGVGVFNFLTGTRTFANAGIIGFSRAGNGGADLYNGPALVAYDLMSNLGPITGMADLLQWTNSAVNTSGGVLAFDSVQDINASFTATVGMAPVPLPAGGLLLLSAMGGVLVLRRRKSKV